jgi:uncharacterized short protein YbdD (DUF466 family)
MNIPEFLTRVRQTLHLMVGMPDYDVYVAHLKAHHPDRAVPDRETFARDCVERRYNSKGQPTRCC